MGHEQVTEDTADVERFVGWSNTGMVRHRSGVRFFPAPHIYSGRPTKAMLDDKHTVVGRLEDHPDAPSVNKPATPPVRASEWYGLPEADIDIALRERGISGSGLDYDGKIWEIMKHDSKGDRE